MPTDQQNPPQRNFYFIHIIHLSALSFLRLKSILQARQNLRNALKISLLSATQSGANSTKVRCFPSNHVRYYSRKFLEKVPLAKICTRQGCQALPGGVAI